MALLSPPFILCPLSEPKDLLGLSMSISPGQDNDTSTSKSSVILTLGKNIAIRYHVEEQKQEISWSSSRHWFTSPVVHVPEVGKLGAIFDHCIVGLWDESDTYLGNLKKHKFQHPLFELKSTKSHGTLGIFKNGHVEPISSLTKTKSKNAPETKRLGVDVGINEKYKLVCTAVDEKNGYVFLLFGIPIDSNIGNVKGKTKASGPAGTHKLSSFKVFTVKLGSTSATTFQNEIVHVTEIETLALGYCIVPNGSDSFVVYFGPDGILLRKSLLSSAPDEPETQSATSLSNLANYLSTENPAVIKSDDPSTLIIYGCDSSEEGATVLIYDITYDLLLSKQSLKLYSSPPIMDKIGSNIFVPVGLHMLVLNLKITKSLLSSMVGRHQLTSTECFESNDPWKEWEAEEVITAASVDLLKPVSGEVPANLSEIVQLIETLESGGQPQSAICTQIIPQVIDLHDPSSLAWTLQHFEDIPESHLILLLDELFEGESEYETNQEQIHNILQRQFDTKLMTRSLRTLPFQKTKEILSFLLKYLDEVDTWEVEQNSQLLKWLSLLLDSHYTEFVIHEETELITRLLAYIEEKAGMMEEIESLEPLLLTTLTKVSFEPGQSPNSKYRRELANFE